MAFPFSAPPLQLLIDPSGLLPPGTSRRLQKAYRRLRRRVPQVDISFCFVWLQPDVSLENFAFWMHNTAPDTDSQRAWQLLVVGDRTSGQLTMTSGYALEPFLKLELWEAALQELAACLSDEQWKEGLNGFLVDARVLLTAAWHEAEQLRLRIPHPRSSASLPSVQGAAREIEHEYSQHLSTRQGLTNPPVLADAAALPTRASAAETRSPPVKPQATIRTS
ncbi:MAG: hypothetical protein CMO40_01125 [Verrucomicrobiaceae bacterium]|nr:hypothetical protein [Verrucomicrobiaceae bacterium]